MNQESSDVTAVLKRIEAGDDDAKKTLVELVYGELHELASGMMRRERADHTLQPTALVHEATFRLLGNIAAANITSRRYFFGAMANAMRNVLVDHARKRQAQRRGGEWQRVPLDHATEAIEQEYGVDLVELDELLTKLADMSDRQSQIVTMRFFGGYGLQEIADHLGVSLSLIQKEWRVARLWLRSQLQK